MLGFLLAMSVTMALIPPLMQVAERFHILDAPGQRKVHVTPVPRVGGIAMAVGTLLALAVSGQFSQPMPTYLAGILVLLVFGVWDDRVTLSAGPKFAGQVIAVLLVMFGGDVGIGTITLTERHVLPPWVGLPLTFLFLIGVTNAINLSDGLDGLAGGTTLLSLSALALLALTSGTPFVGAVAIVIIGAILGFLRFNTHPARVFMGDGGSQILGFSAATLAVVLTQDQATPLSSALPLLLLGIPIIDTLMVMTQRIIAGHSPFKADRNHIHHRLLALGFDHHEAVVGIYLLQASLFLAAWFLRYESDLTIIAVFAGVSVLSIVSLQVAGKYHWQWRLSDTKERVHTSGLGLLVQWLRWPDHLPRWALVGIAAALSSYFLSIALDCPVPSPDVRAMAVLLSVGIGAALLIRFRAVEASLFDKAALYVAVVIAVYFDRQTDTVVERVGALQFLLFGLLVLSIVLRFRLASDRRFRVSTLDVLVIFVAIAVPNLPGSIVSSVALGESVAKLIALMYGVETLLGGAARWWRLPSVAACGFLATCALRGMF